MPAHQARMRYQHICRFCRYQWLSQRPHPVQCPRPLGCGRSHWESPQAAAAKDRRQAMAAEERAP